MAEVGILPPPEGVTPDFYSWTSLQNTLVIVFSVTFAIATILLVLRVYTAIGIVKKLDWDIFFVFAAWGTSLAFFIGMVIAMPAGFGRHLWDVTQMQLLGYYKVLLLLAITYIWPPTFTKLALLVLYIRLNPSKPFHACVYILGVLITGYTVVFTVLFAGPCNPLSVGSGQCLNNIAIAQAVLNIVSDVAIVVLPIPMIMKLQLPLKQKVAVGILICMGSAVVIVSIARTAYVRAIVQNPDVTYTQASAAVLSSFELNIGIMGNCLSRMKPFVQTHFSSWGTTLGTSRTPAGYSGSKSGNMPRSWRGDKGNQSYKLESVERGGDFADQKQDPENNIYVVNDYCVEYDGNKPAATGTGSTESILAPERDGRRVV